MGNDPHQHPPPSIPAAWLQRTLRHHSAGPSILGDLLQDYQAQFRSRGRLSARAFYWVEAVLLVVGFRLEWIRQKMQTKLPRSGKLKTMIEALAPKGLWQDSTYALKAIRKDLGLLSFSVAIIGIGIGATTAVFSVMSPLLIEPLPFEEPERLVWISNDGEGGRSAVTSRTSNLRDFREQTQSFAGIAGYNAFFEQQSFNLVGAGDPERLSAVGVTHNFLEVLGVEPQMGRNFTIEEGARWDDSTIILSHALWQQRFAGDPEIAGQSVLINGHPSDVIGVLPASFDFASIFTPNVRVDFLTTFPVNDDTDRWGNTISMIGRLAPGVSADTAQAELDNLIASLEEAQPDRWGLGAQVAPLQGQISGPYRSALLLLLAAASVVMLIVCVNLCSLLLSKGIHRRTEMSLRSALGAPRGRLLRQMLIESLVLTGGGAIVGVALATALTRGIANSNAIAIPLLQDVRVDGRALLFTIVTAVLAGLAVGIIPAFQASKAGTAGALRATGRALSSSKGTRWLRESLVVTEVAMACALLVAGGLLLQSFTKVLQVDLGFEPTNVASWLVSTEREFDSLEARTSFYRELADEVSTVPGVSKVGYADAIPLGINRQWGVRVPGQFYEQGEQPSLFPHIVDHRYLSTMGIPLLRGRNFAPDDDLQREPVVILNQSAAEELFPGEDAVGKLILTNQETRVIGVAADIRHVALEETPGLQMYLPFTQVGAFNTLDLVVRSDLPLDQIQAPVSAAMKRIDPLLPTNDVRSLDSVVSNAASPRRFTLLLLSGFAATALFLAALGIYGVLSYTVSERAREISIRMALGESTAQVRRRVLGRTAALALAGVTLGILGALAASRLLATLLFGIESTNPATFFTMAAVLLVVALLAGLLPAVRASRTDALAILRTT